MKKLAVFIVAAALLGWASLASSGTLAYSALFYKPSGVPVYSLLGDGGVDDGGATDLSKPPDMTRLPDLTPPPDMTPPPPPVLTVKNGRCLRTNYRPTSDGGRVVDTNVPVYWNQCGGYFCTFSGVDPGPNLCEPLKVQFMLVYKKTDCTGELVAIFQRQREQNSYTTPPTGGIKPKFKATSPRGAWFNLKAPLASEPVGVAYYAMVSGRCAYGYTTRAGDVIYSVALTTPPAAETEIYAEIPKWIP